MHASNLLKAVLKPRTLASSSSGQPLNTKKDSSHGRRPSSPESRNKDVIQPRGPRASSPETSVLGSLSVNQKKSPAPPPVKMSCLCAPTNHAGSFRCRLHRGTQQTWGGKPLAPSEAPSTKPSAVVSGSGPAVMPVAVGNGTPKRSVHQTPTPRHPSAFLAPVVHRSCEAKPSRLSKVSAAADAERPTSHDQAECLPSKEESMRHFKSGGGAVCASGAVLEGGMIYIKKLQAGGKDAMLDVFGSGSRLSRAGLML